MKNNLKNNNKNSIEEELDKELLNEDQFFVKYGYYFKDEDFDWQTPLEFGDN